MPRKKAPMVTPLVWAGNKSEMLDEIALALPKMAAERRWIVPFCGSLAPVLYFQPKTAVISDFCKPLVDFWAHCQRNPKALVTHVRKRLPDEVNVAWYATVRDTFNEDVSNGTVESSALWFLMNRFGFRGRYRVNSKGLCNIPFDHTRKSAVPSVQQMVDRLPEFSKQIRGWDIFHEDWRVTLQRVIAGDFVYVDPPYDDVYDYSDMVVGTEPFGKAGQMALKVALTKAHAKTKALVLVHNNPTALVTRMFSTRSWRPIVYDRDHKMGYGKTLKPGAKEAIYTAGY